MKILILFLFTCQLLTAQSTPTLQISFDPTIAITGDKEHNINPGLNNVLIKSRWTGKQKTLGYLYIAPSFEYAKLSQDFPEYYRYSIELGYTFNSVLDNLEISYYFDYGITKRGRGAQSFSFGGVIGYSVTNTIKPIITLQIVNRVDFTWLYSIPAQLKHSVFIGVEIKLK